MHSWDFLSGPVVKTPLSQCRGLGPTPSQGTKISQATRPKERERRHLPPSTASTSTLRVTKVLVTRSMWVYSISSSRFFLSFSLFLVTSLSSTSSFRNCSWNETTVGLLPSLALILFSQHPRTRRGFKKPECIWEFDRDMKTCTAFQSSSFTVSY